MLIIRKSVTLETESLGLTFTRQEVNLPGERTDQILQIRVNSRAANNPVCTMELSERHVADLIGTLCDLQREMYQTATDSEQDGAG